VSHQLMGGTRDWDYDDAAPFTVEGGDTQNRAGAAAADEAGSAEPSDGADAAGPGQKRSSSRQAAQLETVSKDGAPHDLRTVTGSGQPQTGLDVVPELDGPRPDSAVHAAHWPQASAESDERRGISIELVSPGEVGQHAREAESARRGGVGSEPSAASSGEGGSGQRQMKSWFFAPSERSHADQVWPATQQYF